MCIDVIMVVTVVEEMTSRRNELQQKLKHFPTDSLRAKVLKDTVIEGMYSIHTYDSIATHASRQLVQTIAACGLGEIRLTYYIEYKWCCGHTNLWYFPCTVEQ